MLVMDIMLQAAQAQAHYNWAPAEYDAAAALAAPHPSDEGDGHSNGQPGVLEVRYGAEGATQPSGSGAQYGDAYATQSGEAGAQYGDAYASQPGGSEFQYDSASGTLQGTWKFQSV